MGNIIFCWYILPVAGEISLGRGESMRKYILAQETERTLRQAGAEARRLGHKQVGSEHLLLAILRRRSS